MSPYLFHSQCWAFSQSASWEMLLWNRLKAVINGYYEYIIQESCFFVAFSFTSAIANDRGYWPPWSPWSHPGMWRDHTCSVQSCPSNQQVDFKYTCHVRRARPSLDLWCIFELYLNRGNMLWRWFVILCVKVLLATLKQTQFMCLKNKIKFTNTIDKWNAQP